MTRITCSSTASATRCTTTRSAATSTRRARPPGCGACASTTRHTFGTLAGQAFPLTDVKAYMGHADVSTTMVYIQFTPQHDAADKLSAIVAAKTWRRDGGSIVA